MKRTLAGLAAAAGLVQLTSTAAYAAPATDPVKALQAELTRGRAVDVVSTAKDDYGRGLSISYRMDGTLGFSPEGEIAADLSQTMRPSDKLLDVAKEGDTKSALAREQEPVRIISSRYDDYVSGPLVDDALPKGIKWVRYRHTDLPTSDRLLEVLEPATLKTLLAHGSSYRDGVLKGKIKTDALVKVSSAFVSRFGLRSKSGRVGTISYTVRFGPTGLVERVQAKAVLPFYDESIRIESDTRYSHWGRRADVLLPAEGEVIEREKLGDKVPYQVPGGWS
ncbi:hypothetical protein EDD27_1371 [Nonomuraea polychroma]|uniref:Uncharacterized protein n=1 Tax=Nonomuraea polychroma TaxID=46176 RepID=A0A438LZS0_9ACTN|nr:hypothetical protein [Nonomuraea polychroma]RVX39039.1 hypothetical protein EDD27_1371 [Nonomuraea polychroma]